MTVAIGEIRAENKIHKKRDETTQANTAFSQSTIDGIRK